MVSIENAGVNTQILTRDYLHFLPNNGILTLSENSGILAEITALSMELYF